MTKTITQMLSAFVIILALIISGCVDTTEPSETGGLTAMESKSISDVYAEEWNNQSVCVWIRGYGDTQGLADIWYNVYVIETDINSTTESTEFKVETGTTPIQIESSNATYRGYLSENWTIDSPEALSIAEGNDTISYWLGNRSKNKMSVDMSIGINPEFSENPIWNIRYNFAGWYPEYISIIIDAKTGDCIEVDE